MVKNTFSLRFHSPSLTIYVLNLNWKLQADDLDQLPSNVCMTNTVTNEDK